MAHLCLVLIYYKVMKILITGVAGFIGMHVAKYLLERGDTIIGIDNINNYYDTKLKLARLKQLNKFNKFNFHKLDIFKKKKINTIFSNTKPQRVVHLAAQAGVRYSILNPEKYINSNLCGFANILENCRNFDVEHLVYASSSSVYGGNTSMPFCEDHFADHPISLYAATKKSNELSAHAYSHLYKIPTTGLRFFTVYGPWGRPDMALFKFTKNILTKKSIEVYNSGKMNRDFTYIDDIVDGVVRVLDKVATPSGDYNQSKPNPSISNAPFRIFNIGNGKSIPLMKYINTLEDILGIKAKIKFIEMQKGDVISTHADNTALNRWVGFKPSTLINKGIKKFVDWYRAFYHV
jgi:UDP-glucuronate 4-epimerase